MSATCDSCLASIQWVQSPNKKPIPLDMTPVAVDSPGAVIVVPGDRILWGYSLQRVAAAIALRDDIPMQAAREAVARDYDAYHAHFATCPNADQHRKVNR